jgi:hypothetical protein
LCDGAGTLLVFENCEFGRGCGSCMFWFSATIFLALDS